jgi:protein arginine kinase
MFGLQEIINNRNSFWKQKGPRNDIVLSTRIRLGRNAGFIPYADSMDDTDFELLQGIAGGFITTSPMGEGTICLNLNELDLHEKRLLLEKNIITSEMETSEKCLILINNLRDFTILVNDSDHFRIQIIRPGFQLYETYKDADTVDDCLNSVVKYAFSENYGYLTPDPANV